MTGKFPISALKSSDQQAMTADNRKCEYWPSLSCRNKIWKIPWLVHMKIDLSSCALLVCKQMAQLGEQDSVQKEKWVVVSSFLHAKIPPPSRGNSTFWLDESEKKERKRKKKTNYSFSVHLICEKSIFSHGLHLICSLKPNNPFLILQPGFQ